MYREKKHSVGITCHERKGNEVKVSVENEGEEWGNNEASARMNSAVIATISADWGMIR